MSEDLPTHIPDEYVAVWKDKSLDELMEMADRLDSNISRMGEVDGKYASIKFLDFMNSYIKSRMETSDYDLDIIVSDKW